jgi:hypothetical protein
MSQKAQLLNSFWSPTTYFGDSIHQIFSVGPGLSSLFVTIVLRCVLEFCQVSDLSLIDQRLSNLQFFRRAIYYSERGFESKAVLGRIRGYFDALKGRVIYTATTDIIKRYLTGYSN